MWTSNGKKFYLFLGIIFIIGLIVGVIFLLYLNEASKDIIFLNINEWIQSLENAHINNIISHLILLSSLFIMSLFIVGLPLILFFIFYNGFSVGFIITSLINIFGIKGFLYGIIYVIITKGVYLFFSSIFVIAVIKIIILLVCKLIKGIRINKEQLALLIKRILICIAIILIYDIVLYFWGAQLINIFNFLLN